MILLWAISHPTGLTTQCDCSHCQVALNEKFSPKFFLINTSVQHLLVRVVFVACHSLVSVIVFCLVAVELVMVVVVVVVGVQVVSVNFAFQISGPLFCPCNVLLVVRLGVRASFCILS